MEYAACFTEDSEGFFKRSLIESCVTSDKNPIKIRDEEILFDAMIEGDNNKKYVYGIDPASEQDNFSIIIIELNETHNRVVYSWTTNRGNFKDRQKTGLVNEKNYNRIINPKKMTQPA